MKDKTTNDFLQALDDFEKLLSSMSFKDHRVIENGPIYINLYKKDNTSIKIFWGPPEFEIDLIIYTKKRKYEFKDLLEIPTVGKWANENRYVERNGRNYKEEFMWLIELFRICLPIVE